MNETEYSKPAREKGYGEPQLQQVEAGPKEEILAHEYSVFSLGLSGEFSMATEQGTINYRAGDTGGNPAGTLHKVCTGPEGGSFLFAKK
ncbi:MAG TPA: hypothetical protein VMZ32_05410 [Gammaproteobacteria bacterium]|nr:hypothetical protein [Gammaproteobacteria bacterium]